MDVRFSYPLLRWPCILLHGVDRRCFLVYWFDILRCNAKIFLYGVYVSWRCVLSYLSLISFFAFLFILLTWSHWSLVISPLHLSYWLTLYLKLLFPKVSLENIPNMSLSLLPYKDDTEYITFQYQTRWCIIALGILHGPPKSDPRIGHSAAWSFSTAPNNVAWGLTYPIEKEKCPNSPYIVQS